MENLESITPSVIEKVDPIAALEFLSQSHNSLERVDCGFVQLLTTSWT